MRMEPNGHLNVYQVVDEVETFFKDLLKDVKYGDCTYPTVCGNYGVCATENCTCPGENSTYFRRLNAAQANSGCVRIIPLSCQKTQSHTFLELKDVNYFRFVNVQHNIDIDSCKMQCLKNCSCEAAFFRYKDDNSSDDCSLQTEVLSLMEFDEKGSGYNAIAFIKVQTISSHRDILYLVLVFVSALVFLVIFAGACCYFGMLRKIRIAGGQKGDNSIDESLIHVTKLRFATNKFRIKLGGGGSGSVYEGCLQDGSKVAVKWLCSDMYQGRKLFLPEVETIGSIHHDNLIRLIGYCVERSNTLLVDEHMSNGSLDKWIFHQNQAVTLNWETRRKIIVGVAKGLEYLHNYCTKSIIHFDIKSQNVLVDKDFNVKISDFGLASLIDKDQTHISTVLKGTPGYMAPEFLMGTKLTVKIDVYSLGVLILEIICGRKKSDLYDDDYLLDVVKKKAEEDQLSDLVDHRNEDMQQHKGDTVKIMMIAISCLQINICRRPSSSNVVKLLEGLMDLEPITNYSFLSFCGNSSRSTSA